ncbi:MAG: folylpolyglutamate synthase/dihydrofolate synthase family protein [Bacteroidota bacterium]|nr:folylpolyglutamate synthase/dihydrofolate synthase family protein [Bacteroidota bacterium]
MTYEQSINYLYTKLPLFSRTGAKAYKADLKNTLTLCNYLDNPQNKIKTIHIAGTNGKGSVSHMLAAVFQQCGYKTGLYTSPHLKDFRERIKINGEIISESFVTGFVEKTMTVSESVRPSFFELTFVMALDYFSKENVEIAIIETGLGGRLDSTNIITPKLSIITNIGRDHMDILGDSLEKIAFEKAGIIKPDINAVIGEWIPETKNVFLNKAAETNSPLFFADEKYEILSNHYDVKYLEIETQNKDTKEVNKYHLDLNGLYQQKNLLTVLTAIELLKHHFSLQEVNIKAALSKVKVLTGLHGRWEVVHEKPLIVLDVAHNEDGIRQLVNQINHSEFKELHIIFGMVKDKDPDKVLNQLPQNATYYFTKANIPRALPEEELRQKALQYHLAGHVFPNVNNALKAALRQASLEDLIIVCGSVFIVGEVNFAKIPI